MLRALFLTLTAVFALSSLSAQTMADELSIPNSERDDYLTQLKEQHATDSDLTALQAQVNSLLSEHALLKGYQVGHAQPEDVLYSVQIPRKGVLQIREERHDAAGHIAVRHHNLNVYGLTPFFSQRCTNKAVDCVILHESQKAPVLRIVRHPDGARELSTAMSYLVREIQRR